MSGSPASDARGTPPEAAPGSMMRGSLWSMGGFAVGQALRFAANLLLTRLLFPAAFGEMALIATLLQGLAMFSDVGIRPAIVQGAREDYRFLKTAWTIQCGRGALLWLASVLIARPAAALYGQASLAWYLPVAGLTALFAGLESVSVATQQRHLRLERLTLIDFSSQTITVIATVVLAALARWRLGADHPSAVWALVGGTLIGSGAKLAMTHLALPRFGHGLLLDRGALAALTRFGRWICLGTLLGFLAAQSDRLIFGKLIPIDLLGVYGIAAALAALPTQAIQRLCSSVLFPGYSRMNGRADFAAAATRARTAVLLGGATVVTGLLACGPLLIRGLYDHRYGEAAWMVQFLAAGAWLQILVATNGAALLALGRVSWHAATSASKVVGLAVLVPAGYAVGDFRGALVGLVAADAVAYVTSAIGASARGARVAARDLGLSALVTLVSVGAVAVASALRIRGWGSLAQFLGAGVTATGAWTGVAGVYLAHGWSLSPRSPTAASKPTTRATRWPFARGEPRREA